MVEVVSVDPRVHVVSVGVEPVGSGWSPPWSFLATAQCPEIVLHHVSASLWDESAEIHDTVRQCDVLLSRDTVTDAALCQRGDVDPQRALIRSEGTVGAGSISVWSALQSWHDLVVAFRDVLEPPVDRAALGRLVSAWAATSVQIAGALVPPEFAPVAATLELMVKADYWATGEAGDDVVRRLGFILLRGGPPWVSGSLPALDRVIRLRRQSRNLSEADLRACAAQALGAAESARRRGADSAARCHALIALTLVTHRSRHPQRITSTLVTHTSELVDPLRRDFTLNGLTDASMPRIGSRFLARGGQGPRPSVVILPGPFGEFHLDMVAALSPAATVTVSDARQRWPQLRRRRPVPQDLWLLSALRRGRIDLEEGRLDGKAIEQPSIRRAVRCLRHLKIELSHHDVAVSDWGDVTTMWASHLRPNRTRLVTRWHSLDLFDPWIHLIDWRGVDDVLISNSALGSLFTDLTRGTAAPTPVVVHPYLPDLHSFEQPKRDNARFTIAMVGWGRLVKDPAFALDLLDRDPRRRLILIGPPFGPTVDHFAREYADALADRIAARDLRDRVDIVGPTDDVAGHLREAGIILSSSFREGWHLGLIEGIASGAVPVVRDWPMLSGRGGAACVYPSEWVVSDLQEADRRIAGLADPQRWQAAASQAQAEIHHLMEASTVRSEYQEYVLGVGRSAIGRRSD